MKNFSLKTVLSTALVGTLLTLSACSPPPQPFNPAADQAALVKEYVDVVKEKKLKGLKKVVIPEFIVGYVTSSTGSSSATSLSSSGGSASVSVTYNLKNVDDAQFQALSDKMYEELVAEFKAAGIEVVPLETLKKNPLFQKLVANGKEAPYEVSKSGQTIRYFGAKGLPLYFDPSDKRLSIGGMFATAFSNFHPEDIEEDLAEELKVGVVKPNFSVTFASMKKSGGMGAGSASVKTSLKVTLLPEDTNYTIITEEGKSRFVLKKPLFSDAEFIDQVVDAQKTGEKVLNAVGNMIGALGGHSSKVSKYDVLAKNGAYTETASANMTGIHKLFFSQMKANF